MITDLICASLFIFGVHFSFSEGNIFYPIRFWAGKLLLKYMAGRGINSYWLKPIYKCPPCMASLWGTMYYFVVCVEAPYLLFIFMLAGLNALLLRHYDF